ncbi:MAG: restriction endonuclease subunit S [Candidatus Electrothrix sp. AW5]|nr:restriction endonuclease subunit S [Candidatus Electrothrix gigas]
MKPYPKYKDSGVEWIGEVPEEWNVKKMKYLAFIAPSNIDKKSKENEKQVFLCNYVDVYKNEFITNEINFMEATASDVQIDKFSLKENDVIITKDSEDPADIAVPALVRESLNEVVCGYHLTLLRTNSNQLFGGFLFWLFNSKKIRNYFETEAKGITRYGIGSYSVESVPIITPPFFQQTAIATFLDRKTAEIDKLIANKERLIELYEEEKKAVINQAVTKGLDPDVEMKDSGVEWLGEIPAHWEVKKLKYLSKLFRGKFGHRPRNDERLYHGDFPFIQTGEVTNSDKYIEGYRQTLNERGYSVSQKFPAGTLVMTIAANIGDVAILNFDACFPDSIIGFFPSEGCD